MFVDAEQAFDMMWKEGLLIKLCNMAVRGRAFHWIKDFLCGKKIPVGSD